MYIPSLPRETQICFILRGVPIIGEECGTPTDLFNSTNNASIVTNHSTNSNEHSNLRINNTNNEKRLASANLPLFNVDG